MIQEIFLSVLSNAADRNRLPRRKIDVHGAQIRHLPALSVCRGQRDTATIQAILVSVTSAIKSPFGTFGRDSNVLFLRVFVDSDILYELFQTA